MNVEDLARRFTINHVGFLTLTFADHVTEMKEAQRRFNSLRTHVLDARYPATITAVERQKSGRIHFHLLVALQFDARTGFDFEAAKNGVYVSAAPELRKEWAFWRETAPRYGFGRTELLPVRSSAGAIGCYLGKYIAKHVQHREQEDKGARLIRYSERARVASVRFSWNTEGMRLWRYKLADFARAHGVTKYDDMSTRFGKRWAFFLREEILAVWDDQPGSEREALGFPAEWDWEEEATRAFLEEQAKCEKL